MCVRPVMDLRFNFQAESPKREWLDELRSAFREGQAVA